MAITNYEGIVDASTEVSGREYADGSLLIEASQPFSYPSIRKRNRVSFGVRMLVYLMDKGDRREAISNQFFFFLIFIETSVIDFNQTYSQQEDI